MADQPTTALAPLDVDDVSLAPLSAEQLEHAFALHRAQQAVIDRAMPDQLVKIGDSYHRKKGAWLAIALARHVSYKLVSERREVFGTFDDGREDFGWLVTMRATGGGRSLMGDGAAFASEKAESFRCPHPHESWEGKSQHFPHTTCPDYDPAYKWAHLPEQATEHNVRSLAWTRAINRAISNLVAFGEVSAEEVEGQPAADDARRRSAPSSSTPRRTVTPISEPQRKRLWGIAHNAGWNEVEVKSLLGMHGFEHDRDVTRDKYDALCELLQAGPDGTRGEK